MGWGNANWDLSALNPFSYPIVQQVVANTPIGPGITFGNLAEASVSFLAGTTGSVAGSYPTANSLGGLLTGQGSQSQRYAAYQAWLAQGPGGGWGGPPGIRTDVPPIGAVMSGTYKVTWNFLDSVGASWSEVHYVTAGTSAAAAQPNYTIIYPRLVMMHKTAILRTIRATNVAGGRDTYTNVLNQTGQYNDTGSYGPAPPGLAAVVSVGGTTGRSIYHWMRGLPDGLVSNNVSTGFPSPPATLVRYITAFFNAYGSIGGAGIRTLTPNPKFQITSVAFNNLNNTATVNYTVATGQTPPVYAAGSRIIISQASKKDLPGLNGGWTVISATNAVGPGVASLVIRYVTPQETALIPCNGFLKTQAYNALVPYATNSAILSYYGTHSTRAVFSNSRGSRRAARLRVLA
jgi:hypothetical protein